MRRRLRKANVDPEKQAAFLAQIRREQAERRSGYREQALALFPHICARCGREFAGKDLRDLTVHHKDGNHNNNPVDGSNWELLCLSCHDDQHQDANRVNHFGGYAKAPLKDDSLSHNPFAALANLVEADNNKAPDT
ncbi:MAG TPA: YajD family HNH nuclease [Candidatus Hydrogenedentes bacterium]|nr:YajD family HNH nuclease [Candidatus Hydrogenedentota bacterium]HRK36279.1 YajD family HNH nuclease [Candidatus Hydrogenedentota bacterium]